jgi:hypothetical protein
VRCQLSSSAAALLLAAVMLLFALNLFNSHMAVHCGYSSNNSSNCFRVFMQDALGRLKQRAQQAVG